MTEAAAFPPAPGTPPASGQTAGIFYGQLSGLLKAGLPLPQALRTLAVEAGRPRFRAALERAAAEIEKGTTPQAAFAAEEAELGSLLARVAAAAVVSGKLPALLAELSAWTLRADRVRRQITEALIYPYAILVLASVMSLVMLTVAQNLFGSGPEDLFSFTQPLYLIANRYSIAQGIIGVILGLCVAGPILSYLARWSPLLRTWRDRLLVYLPVFGAVCRPLALARFCGGTAILLKAGTPYHEAVAAAGSLAGSAIEKVAERAADDLEGGHANDEAWAGTRLFPPSLRFILASAHARGDVPEAFAELAELYEVEADARSRMVALLAPPVFLLAVGCVIVALLCALVTPLFMIFPVSPI